MPLFDPNRITKKSSDAEAELMQKKNSCQVLRDTIVRSIRTTAAAGVCSKGCVVQLLCEDISTMMVLCACANKNPLLRKTVRVLFVIQRT